jgi:hypothetical protein
MHVDENGDESLSSVSDEKPELPKSVNQWRTANSQKPHRKRLKNKRKGITPPCGVIETTNPFDLDQTKRSRNE